MALHEILSANQKTPRNKVLNDLLDIAIDQVKKELDQDSYENCRLCLSIITKNYLPLIQVIYLMTRFQND